MLSSLESEETRTLQTQCRLTAVACGLHWGTMLLLPPVASMLQKMSSQAPTDHEILQQVALRLKRHHSSARLVSANVVRGIVVLSGQVVSFHHRQICIAAAQQVAGVVRIDDQLDVVGASTQEKPKHPARIRADRKLVKK
jgi:osmotically-inducible protein OsmY